MSCRLSGVTSGISTISQCSVNFATQNQRPLNGYVAILAWLEGYEAYIDRNGNGKYAAGEPFYDTGRLFRDDDHDGPYTRNVDELNLGSTGVSSPGLGTSVCDAIAQATGGVVVSLQWSSDLAHASTSPAGTAVSVVSAPAGCTFSVSPPTVPNNSVTPTFHRLTPAVSGTFNSGQVTVMAAFGTNEVTVTANLPL